MMTLSGHATRKRPDPARKPKTGFTAVLANFPWQSPCRCGRSPLQARRALPDAGLGPQIWLLKIWPWRHARRIRLRRCRHAGSCRPAGMTQLTRLRWHARPSGHARRRRRSRALRQALPVGPLLLSGLVLQVVLPLRTVWSHSARLTRSVGPVRIDQPRIGAAERALLVDHPASEILRRVNLPHKTL